MSKVEPVEMKETSSTEDQNGDANHQAESRLNPILDRSRAELRLPADLVTEALRIAQLQRYRMKFNRAPENAEPPEGDIVERLQASGIIQSGPVADGADLDPIAFELLDVVNMASLMITIDLRFGAHSSAPTIWATPKLVVSSSSLDPDYVEFSGAEVGQLPQLLAQLAVLRSPQFVGQSPIAVNTKALVEAEGKRQTPEAAIEVLMAGGLELDQAKRVLAFQGDGVRRWRIRSSWSTDEGQKLAELRGLDAGVDGQWLLALTGSRDQNGQMNFTPQGHGELMKALRSVLPKHWVGTPLTQPAI